MCDLTRIGSDAISHLAFQFVNEENRKFPKKSRIALAAKRFATYAAEPSGQPVRPPSNILRTVPAALRLDEIAGSLQNSPLVGFSADALKTSVQHFKKSNPVARIGPQDRGFSAGKGVQRP